MAKSKKNGGVDKSVVPIKNAIKVNTSFFQSSLKSTIVSEAINAVYISSTAQLL